MFLLYKSIKIKGTTTLIKPWKQQRKDGVLDPSLHVEEILH